MWLLPLRSCSIAAQCELVLLRLPRLLTVNSRLHFAVVFQRFVSIQRFPSIRLGLISSVQITIPLRMPSSNSEKSGLPLLMNKIQGRSSLPNCRSS